MKTTSTVVFASLFALTLAGGCKKHDEATAPTEHGPNAGSSAAMTGSAAMAGSAATAASVPKAAPAAPDVPTAVDFEPQAANEITDKNLESQLDKVEKDLGN